MAKAEILEQKGYKFLWVDDELWMWDVPQEVADQRRIAQQAYGDVLVAGYGLGIVQRALVANPRVNSVLTVERLEEVVQECAKAYGGLHGEVVIADFHEFRTNRRYDCVVGDIWADVSWESLDEYARFKAKAETLLKKGGKILGWGMDYLEFMLEKRDTKAY